jgi:nitric oxide dioxygenase
MDSETRSRRLYFFIQIFKNKGDKIMTEEQINLIQKSFGEVALQSDAVATIFYNRLFEMQPTLRLLFPADLSEQKKKLITTLALAIKTLRNPEALIPVLENLGRKHALYGVRVEHYEIVGAALLQTLEEMLGGHEFNSTVSAAWAEMYGFVAKTMQSAAHALAAEAIPPVNKTTKVAPSHYQSAI